ncbi:TIR domain-containing protein [Jongsikchunia kroppenstedtii]|uniref:TIR domain-containing protein n=1 Tax=Jongsikchunia kroppenstedtii TaxID=1121721 RepID=UPI000371C2ED|nr:TIR domain-containing protein [Jongsikchunia kroppenstedtii]
MGHTVYISFKFEDQSYKDQVQSWDHLDYVDRSLNEKINSENADYIMQKIRSDYLRGSTVTIFLIGDNSAEIFGWDEQQYIKRELQGSLYNGAGNTRNGILGVVLPSMMDSVYGGKYACSTCQGSHNLVRMNDSTVIKEFGHNYYIPHDRCAWTENERYCVLVGWEDFRSDPNSWIDKAFDKRDEPIAQKVTVYP